MELNWQNINYIRTLETYGYNPKTLTAGSEKKVIANCTKCQKEKILTLSNALRAKYCTSCAQTLRMKERIKHYLGQTFGKLTIIDISDKYYKNHFLINTICECGNKAIRTLTQLKKSKNNQCDLCLEQTTHTKKTFGYFRVQNEKLAIENKAICNICHEIKPKSDFTSAKRKLGILPRCSFCNNWYTYRSLITFKNYKLLIQKYDSCRICGSKEKLCLDHCHKTKKIRGIVCSKHNLALGLFNDDIVVLQKAIEYLKEPQCFLIK